jgi:hypothetical protein
MSKAPLTIRWRDGVMDAALSSAAKVSAMPLARHADLDGKNCYPGRKRCADEMSVSESTIKRGWRELSAAGWLEILPLPQGRRRTQGALKVLRFPDRHGVTVTPSQTDIGSQNTSNPGLCDPQPIQVTERPPGPEGPPVSGKPKDVCACGSRLHPDGTCSMCD